MVTGYIKHIRHLAERFSPHERNLPLYFPDFQTRVEATCLNRVFGAPIGIDRSDWPQYPRLGELLVRSGQLEEFDTGDLRMEHVFTIDLRGVRLPAAPANASAMLLFISNADAHHAYQNGNLDTAVVFLTQEDLERATRQDEIPKRSRGRWSRRFCLRRVDVPGDVFDAVDDPPASPMSALRDAIWQAPARLGGCPMWVREPNDPRDQLPHIAPARRRLAGLPGRGSFLMQFDRRFADINLGQNGLMYVSGTDAYYQDYSRNSPNVYVTPASL